MVEAIVIRFIDLRITKVLSLWLEEEGICPGECYAFYL